MIKIYILCQIYVYAQVLQRVKHAFCIFLKIEILQQFLIKFLQTKSNNFKNFRFFAKSMLTIIRKVILDNLMQKEIEFIIRARKI